MLFNAVVSLCLCILLYAFRSIIILIQEQFPILRAIRCPVALSTHPPSEETVGTWQKETAYLRSHSAVRTSFIMDRVHHMKMTLTDEWERLFEIYHHAISIEIGQYSMLNRQLYSRKIILVGKTEFRARKNSGDFLKQVYRKWPVNYCLKLVQV